ncbi:MAG TPA: helix-turn-helix domain-containing protein [Nocardioides sp.]|nr:helix-turn-helix domain-containing protein [Nocardioides sp.]
MPVVLQNTKANPYLSLSEAAEIVGQSVNTLRRRIASGTLPAYRFGPRSIRVRLADVEALGRRIPSAHDGP